MKIRFCLVALLLAGTSHCLAQSSDVAPTARLSVPDAVVKGFSSYTHDKGSDDVSWGCSTFVSSSVQYDGNKHFGVGLGIPFYLSHNGVPANVVAKGKTNPPLTTQYGSLGDAALTLNFVAGGPLGYKATVTGTAPTGDTSSGISTGRPTFDLNNHLEREVGFLTPFAEFGFGDSSALVNKRVRRPYPTLGALSHFKAGAGMDFLKYFSFSLSGYETLPIGNQKVYSHEFVRSKNGTVIRVGADGKKHRFASVSVVSGQGILETTALPNHLVLNLSLHIDLYAT